MGPLKPRERAGEAKEGVLSIPVQMSNSVALVFSGGAALGAYQAGAYERLHSEPELAPCLYAGFSIGAVNAAIILGSAPEARVAKGRLRPDRFGVRSLRSGSITSAAGNGCFSVQDDGSGHRCLQTLVSYVRDRGCFRNHAGSGLVFDP
jgi:predicted acylesterase/phospholipase RssA